MPWQSARAELFTGLGDLPGGIFRSVANGISADGSTVVGFSESAAAGTQAFRWTLAEGMVGLAFIVPGPANSSIAFDASADGSTIVGWGVSAASAGNDEAFRWTQAGGSVGLGDFPGGEFYSYAIGVSDNGSVIAGRGETAAGVEAFRWTQAEGMVGLGDLPGGQTYSTASGISADGSIIVGTSYSASGPQVFRWTQADGMVGLGDLLSSNANGLSADGSTIVGGSGSQAFRWTQDGGKIGLGDLAGGVFFSEAQAVSADGSVIVGWSNSTAGDEAFVWDQSNGMRSLKEVLVDIYGLDLAGWTLTRALGISADGTKIVGHGTNPSGFQEAWYADLSSSSVPEPSSLVLLTIVGTAAAVHGWHKRRRRMAK